MRVRSDWDEEGSGGWWWWRGEEGEEEEEEEEEEGCAARDDSRRRRASASEMTPSEKTTSNCGREAGGGSVSDGECGRGRRRGEEGRRGRETPTHLGVGKHVVVDAEARLAGPAELQRC